MRRIVASIAIALSACQDTSEVLFPDGALDIPGLSGDRVAPGDGTQPNDLGTPAGAPVLGSDGRLVGVVASDGAVIDLDGTVVGGIAPDGAVLANDGAVLGTLGDASVAPDATVPDAPPPDGTSSDVGAAMDGAWPVANDGAFRPDARLPDGAPACPTDWRGCGELCIPPATCCTSAECGMLTCTGAGGRCSCAAGSRMCGERCVSELACCADADCPAPYRCPTVGSVCRDTMGCPVGTRGCAPGRCIPIGNCCTTADCRGGTCPSEGAMCMGGERCAIGSRLCGSTCIPERTCCNNMDCAGGFVCPMPGTQCVCPTGQRLCMGRCIPNGTCCTDDDCPMTRCLGAGMACPPVPPRIPVKRWGINPEPEDGGGSMSWQRYELTTTTAEETALRMAVPMSTPDGTPSLTLTNPSYFTIYGPGTCPRDTVALWGVDRAPVRYPRPDHILTASQSERDLLVSQGWTATQLGCVVAGVRLCPAGTIPVSRFTRHMDSAAENHRFVLDADRAEAGRQGLFYESLAFCAFDR